MPPEPIKKFITRFSSLPSIGPRQAARLAFQLINRGKAEIKDVADAVAALQKIGVCKRCFFIHENENGLCGICSDGRRKADVITIVEKETDLLSLERAGKFSGRYLVLGRLDKGGMLENAQKGRLRTLIKKADILIGAAAIPHRGAPKLLTKEALSLMPQGGVFVDISIDEGGISETSRPTSHGSPIYAECGITHCCVPNLPALEPRKATDGLSEAAFPHLKNFINSRR